MFHVLYSQPNESWRDVEPENFATMTVQITFHTIKLKSASLAYFKKPKKNREMTTRPGPLISILGISEVQNLFYFFKINLH